MKDLEQALLVMTDKQREVIELRLQGLTQQQIAEKLHITQPAVHYHIKGGTQRAKKIISIVM